MQNIKEIIKEIKTIFTQGGNEAYFGREFAFKDLIFSHDNYHQ